MGFKSEKDIFAPPKLGVRLLAMFLPLEVAENEMGDLEEEYRDKVKRAGLEQARRWFWIQVLCTLGISIREDGLRRLLLGRARQWYRRRVGNSSVSFDADQVAWSRLFAFLTILLALFCILVLYSMGFLTTPRNYELAQRQDTVPRLSIGELSKSVPLSEKRQAPEIAHRVIDKNVLAATKRLHGMSYKTVKADLASVAASSGEQEQNQFSSKFSRPGCTTVSTNFSSKALCVNREEDMLLMRVTIKVIDGDSKKVATALTRASGKEIEFRPYNVKQRYSINIIDASMWNALNFLSEYGQLRINSTDFAKFQRLRSMMLRGGEASMNFSNVTKPELAAITAKGIPENEEPPPIVEGLIKTVVATPPIFTDIASRSQDRQPPVEGFIQRREREYLSAPSVLSKSPQQSQTQAVSERGCFW